MKPSRTRTLLIGLTAGLGYGFLVLLLANAKHLNVSIAYIFILPIILGAIPVFFSTREQLQSYITYLIVPWVSVITFFILCYVAGFEGMICLAIIILPFLLLATLGAWIFRLLRLRHERKGKRLYVSLLLPFLFLAAEMNIEPKDQLNTVSTTIQIAAGKPVIWHNIKDVRNINPSEIETHFINLIGIPKPVDGRMNGSGVGTTRNITWEKGIRFQERIKSWEEGNAFSYDIKINPNSIPPATLDEHVIVGGRYFDVVEGSYQIEEINPRSHLVHLTCTYRVTTNFNFYSKFWADYILSDFNQMILEVIKKRCEASRP